MAKKRIWVFGSTNTDMVIKTEHFPKPGETIIGGTFFMNPGGKGANQAVAAARLGGDVVFAGKTGNDIFGEHAVSTLKKEGIMVDYMAKDPNTPSGVAMITVDSKGENSIVVSPGANGTYSPQDLNNALSLISEHDIILMQLEIPLETVEYVAEEAVKRKTRVILNPAPAVPLSGKLLKSLYMITPNETEAEVLTGIHVDGEQSASMAARRLKENGISIVIITMGSLGAFVLSDTFEGMIPAPWVKPVDTTAAGDTFNGALAVAVTEGMPIVEAVNFACEAASISVTRMGAQASIPFRKETER